MTNDRFIQLDSALLRKAEEILNQRKGGYATEADRLANFKDGAARSGITPLQVCHLYLQKGLAVLDKFAQGRTVPGETVEERFCDAINYIRLMYALYKEQEEDVPEKVTYISKDNEAFGQPASFSVHHDEVAKQLDRRPQGRNCPASVGGRMVD